LVSRASGAGFRVDPVCPTVARVTLWGRLPLAWLGQLSAALSRRGIGIRDVRADREQDGTWQVVLELCAEKMRAAPHAQELSRIDYLALTEELAPDSSDPSRPRLMSFYLGRDVYSSLELQVRAEDELGFLSALFVRLGFLGLFPVKVRATTVGDRIDDTFMLHGVGGAAPSVAAERALRAVLTRLTRPPSERPAG
jgi:UTP:GlnB (protein PII) uridylyltransferase